MIDFPETINPDIHINYIEEQSLKLEDDAYIKYGIKFYEFRAILQKKKEQAEAPNADS